MSRSLGAYISIGRDSYRDIRSLVQDDSSFVILDEIEEDSLLTDSCSNDPHRFPLGLSPLQIKYLRDKPQAVSLLAKKLKGDNFVCKFDLEAGKAEIRAPEGREETEALAIIKDSIIEMEFPAELMAMMSDTTDYLPSQPFGIEALVVKTGSVVTLVGMGIEDLGEDLRKSMNILDTRPKQRESRKQKVFSLDKYRFTYLYEYKWQTLATKMKGYPRAKLDHDGCKITLSCPAFDFDAAVKDVKYEIDRIRILIVQLPANINVAEVLRITTTVEKNQGCIIAPEMFGTGAAIPQPSELPTSMMSISLSIANLKEARVRVVMNAIENQKAHVIVNTTNSELELSRGGTSSVSFSILQAAGPTIQSEVRQNNPRGIKGGEIAVSGPGNISTCKTIYHGSLPAFPQNANSPNYEKEKDDCFKWLVSMVFNSLIKASTSEAGYATIAFPALGTGQLQYPPQHVVQLMYRAIKLYNDDKRSGNLKDIIIVIYPDTKLEVKQMFLAYRQTYKLNTLQVSSLAQIHDENREEDSRHCEFRISLGETLLQVVHCNLREAALASEAIILLWTPAEINDPNTNRLLKTLDPVKQSWDCCISYVSELTESMCTVDTTTMKQKTLLHCMCKDDDEITVTAAIAKGLNEASKAGCNTVTIPVSTSGIIGKKPLAASKWITSVVKRGAPNVYVVTVAIDDPGAFCQIAKTMEEKQKKRPFQKPVDTDKSTVAVDLYMKTFAGQAAEKQDSLQRMMTLTSAQSSLHIVSDSDQKNLLAKGELCERLNIRLSLELKQD